MEETKKLVVQKAESVQSGRKKTGFRCIRGLLDRICGRKRKELLPQKAPLTPREEMKSLIDGVFSGKLRWKALCKAIEIDREEASRLIEMRLDLSIPSYISFDEYLEYHYADSEFSCAIREAATRDDAIMLRNLAYSAFMKEGQRATANGKRAQVSAAYRQARRFTKDEAEKQRIKTLIEDLGPLY